MIAEATKNRLQYDTQSLEKEECFELFKGDMTVGSAKPVGGCWGKL